MQNRQQAPKEQGAGPKPGASGSERGEEKTEAERTRPPMSPFNPSHPENKANSTRDIQK